MTETLTATDTKNQDMPEIDKLASKILGIGGAAVSGVAAWGMGKSAGALLFGYATYGAALPLLGYAGVFVAAGSLLKYHGKKLGWDKAPGEDNGAPEASAVVPLAATLNAASNEIQGEIDSLNARVDELTQDLSLKSSSPSASMPRRPD